MDYDKLSHNTKKYWDMALCGEITCAICKDGQLFMFDEQDIIHLLAKYPTNAKKTKWYFNATKDREIGELNGDGKVVLNPQFVYQNFNSEDIIV